LSDERKKSFEKGATEPDPRLLVDYLRFLSRNKKYWLIPIIVFLLLIGLLVVLGGSVAGAFIYTFF
jgi:hypothetical protein